MIQPNENNLIITWHTGAELIALTSAKTKQEKKETIKTLAKEQLKLLEETRPNKEKTLKEQLNKEQLELVNYLEDVAETGEY